MSVTIDLQAWGTTDFFQNPYPVYERLRRANQPVTLPAFDAPVVFGYTQSRLLLEHVIPVTDADVKGVDRQSINAACDHLKALLGGFDRGRVFDFVDDVATPLTESFLFVEDAGEMRFSSDAFIFRATLKRFMKQFLSGALLTLLKHPKQQAMLRANPARIPQAVNELLRFDSPIVMVPIQLLKPFTIEEAIFQAEGKLYICIPAANHDPRVYPNADVFDLMRHRPQSNLTLIAPGQDAFLFREVCEALLAVLIGYLPYLRLVSTPVYGSSVFYRSLSSLPVRRV